MILIIYAYSVNKAYERQLIVQNQIHNNKLETVNLEFLEKQ